MCQRFSLPKTFVSKRDPSRRPSIATALSLLLLILVLRILEIFVFKLDDRLGELFVSKSMGVALVVGYVWATGGSVGDIGFHRRRLGSALVIGGVGMLAFFGLGYLLQFLSENLNGNGGRLVLTSIDPITGAERGLSFAAWLMLAHILNSSVDEGLFRGVLLQQFLRRFTFWRALLLQAVLFGIWHFVWPLEDFVNNDASLTTAMADASALVASTTLLGLVLGYMALKTGSLWAPWIAHTINNAAISLLYIRTDAGLLSADEFPVFAATFALGMLFLMLWTRVMSRGLN